MGALDDGYVTTTGIMMKSYNRRPGDFKRKILEYIQNNDHKILHERELHWLNKIKDKELFWDENIKNKTVRYYNMKKFAQGGAWNKGRSNLNNTHNYTNLKYCEYCDKSFPVRTFSKWHGKRCLLNINSSNEEIYRYRIINEEKRQKLKEMKHLHQNFHNNQKYKCDYCDVVSTKGNILRWHNKKCKNNGKHTASNS